MSRARTFRNEKSRRSILVVDDDEGICIVLKEFLENQGFSVLTCGDGDSAQKLVASANPDLVILDINLPDMHGINLIEQFATKQRAVIMLTGQGSLENAVAAIKQGAYDFLTKPFDPEKTLISIQRALKYVELSQENQLLKNLQQSGIYFEEFIGESKEIQRFRQLIPKLVSTDVPIMITGETGTGKNILATQIHFMLGGPDTPLVYTNCSSIPGTLFESELFGHEKGAFTGATTHKTGRVEEADGGTLILDEITEIPYELQAKMLDFIQEKRFYRVGCSTQKKVAVRIIALSNRDLNTEIKEGRFRQDLYYRLNVMQFHIPPLRERPGDILLLTDHFISILNKKYGKRIKNFSDAAKQRLCSHTWPGNVRELKNTLERAFILCEGNLIGEKMLHFENEAPLPSQLSLKDLMAEYEKQVLLQALARNGGNRKKTAAQLEISLRNLQYKLARYDIGD